MYARLVRFEGAEPAVLEREIDEMRKQIQAGTPDGSGEIDESQMEMLRKTIKRMLVLSTNVSWRGRGQAPERGHLRSRDRRAIGA